MDKELLSRRIKSQLALKGMGQPDLADHLGIALTSVNNKLNGLSPWKDEELFLLAQLFECSVDYLLGGDNNGEV